MYCDKCNAVLVTDEDIDCLVCNKSMKEIGFTDKPIQDLFEYEKRIGDNNEG
jgi:DNA-directed RNA polymerase subunit M/transcription elongation factor TFIIS